MGSPSSRRNGERNALFSKAQGDGTWVGAVPPRHSVPPTPHSTHIHSPRFLRVWEQPASLRLQTCFLT